jgi:hypothetical protein
MTLQVNLKFVWLSGFLKRFSKIFPIEADVEMFNPNVALIAHGDHELNKIDSALYEEALV